jgi:putative transposase
MNLVERHLIKKSNCYYKELDTLSFTAKNLYNSILYIWRQKFIKNEKITNAEIYLKIRKTKEFKSLPQNVSAQIFLQFCKEINCFFKSIKAFNKNSSNFTGKPGIPKYKDSIKGRCMLIYNKRVLPKKGRLRDGYIRFTGLSLKVKSKNEPKQVRIIPRNKEYIIEVVYEKEAKKNIISNNYAGLDLGVNNLGVLSYNNSQSVIINGRPLKSINQFYNKKKSNLQKISKCRTSNKIINLTNKRNRKIKDYLHKASRFVVNQLVSKNISTLVIGNNKMWKQDIKIGSRNNQNFVSIPHAEFINMIKYKCELEGILVITTGESYTSKCSFIDFEKIQKHQSYCGKRQKRGLFISKSGKKINADLNGSLNILRKVFPNCFTNGIEGLLVSPGVYTPKL